MTWWLLAAFAIKAGDSPRGSPASVTNVQAFPIRVALASPTNLAPVLTRNAARIQQGPLQWTIESSAEGRRFARSLAVADIDGDGLADLFVGQPRGATARHPGVVSVFRGGEAALARSAPILIEGVRPRDMFGFSLANAGDVNGDGLDDVVLGAPDYSSGEALEGAFFLLYGRRNRESLPPDFHVESDSPRVQLGLGVASAGDVNGDGYADLLVGAPRHPGKSFQEGVAYLYLGFSTGLVTAAVWTCSGSQREAHCGQAVVGAGDVNRDGFADVLVGMPDYDSDQSDAGQVLLFLGSKSGLKDKPDSIVDGPHAHARFGAVLAAAGDLNGDGYGDVLVGAPGAGDQVKLSGWVYAYLGNSNGLAKTPAWAVSDHQDGALFGSAIAAVGDLDGDRHADVLIGAPGFDGGYADQGRVCLFLGRPGGLPATPDWTLEGGRPEAGCGGCVAAASDVNHDGLSDFLIAAPVYSRVKSKEGRVDLFLGSRTGYRRGNDFPADGTNSVTLPRRAFLPPMLAVAPVVYSFPPRRLYLGSAALVVALGAGFCFWRRHVRAALVASRTEERVRIARDLHDQVGPHLTRLDQITTRGSRASDDPETSSPASTAPKDIARALEQAVWAIDPGRDSLESLVSFLAEQGESLFAGTQVRCRFDLPESLPGRALPATVRQHAAPCIQEALANVLKHSGATEVWLRVKHEQSWLTIWVEDNGRGISTSPSRRFGNGLKNMKQRADAMGGEFAIAAGPSGGTQVTVRFKV